MAPSLTLGCGSPGRNATSDNVTPLHLIDIRRVAFGVREAEPSRECVDYSKLSSGSADDYIEQITRMVLKKLQQ